MSKPSEFLNEVKVIFDCKRADIDCKAYAKKQGKSYTYITVVGGMSSSFLSNASGRVYKYPECTKYQDSYERLGVSRKDDFIKLCELFELDYEKYIIDEIKPGDKPVVKNTINEEDSLNLKLISEYVCEMATAQRQMLELIKIQDERIKNQNAMILSMKNCLDNLGKVELQSMEYLKSIDVNLK